MLIELSIKYQQPSVDQALIEMLTECQSRVNQQLTTDALSTHDPPNQPMSLLSTNQDLCFPVEKTG